MNIDSNFKAVVGNATWKHDGGMSVSGVWVRVNLAAIDRDGKHIVTLVLNGPRIGSDKWSACRIGYPPECRTDTEMVKRAQDAAMDFYNHGPVPMEELVIPPFEKTLPLVKAGEAI